MSSKLEAHWQVKKCKVDELCQMLVAGMEQLIVDKYLQSRIVLNINRIYRSRQEKIETLSFNSFQKV